MSRLTARKLWLRLGPAPRLAAGLVTLMIAILILSQLFVSGFLPNPATGELVTPFPGGFAFSLRHDQKVIPPSEVKKELERRVKSHAAAGLPLTLKSPTGKA